MTILQTINKYYNSLYSPTSKYKSFEDALNNGNESDAIALLDTVEDVNAVNLSGTSFLMLAASENYQELFRKLIEKVQMFILFLIMIQQHYLMLLVMLMLKL